MRAYVCEGVHVCGIINCFPFAASLCVCVCMRTCMYVCMCVCVCVCVCVCTCEAGYVVLYTVFLLQHHLPVLVL